MIEPHKREPFSLAVLFILAVCLFLPNPIFFAFSQMKIATFIMIQRINQAYYQAVFLDIAIRISRTRLSRSTLHAGNIPIFYNAIY
jgi:hypothetical protein